MQNSASFHRRFKWPPMMELVPEITFGNYMKEGVVMRELSKASNSHYKGGGWTFTSLMLRTRDESPFERRYNTSIICARLVSYWRFE